MRRSDSSSCNWPRSEQRSSRYRLRINSSHSVDADPYYPPTERRGFFSQTTPIAAVSDRQQCVGSRPSPIALGPFALSGRNPWPDADLQVRRPILKLLRLRVAAVRGVGDIPPDKRNQGRKIWHELHV